MAVKRMSVVRGILGASLVIALGACKAKISTTADNPAPVDTFTNQVQGPNIEGDWQSGCVQDTWGDGFVVFNVSVQGRNILRTETKFQDNKCVVQVSQLTRMGMYRYLEALKNDIFVVEYKIQMKGGFYYLKENLKLVNDHLWMADRYSGEGVDPDIELVRVVVNK